MSYLAIILILISFQFFTYAQLKGTSEAGRLIPLNEQTKLLDKTPPVITVTKPMFNGDSLTVNYPIIELQGKVSGQSRSVNLFVNNERQTLTKDNTFKNTIKLTKGVNKIQLTAGDNYKNYSTLRLIIIYTPIELKPEITLIEPQIKSGDELSVKEKLLTIKGIIKTHNGIGNVAVNGKYPVLSKEGNFTITYVLQKGSNDIVIKCFDKKGNSSEKNFTVNYIPFIDTIPPVIALSKPLLHNGDSLIVNHNSLTINGSVFDKSDSLRLYINNISEPLTSENGFSHLFKLSTGINSISLTAIDKYNNTSSLRISVVYKTIKPVITLIEPKNMIGNELSVNKKILSIKGTVKTLNGIDSVLINNKSAVLTNNREFSINYELNYGINNIVIKAIDKEDNSSEKSFTVNWAPDISGPVIRIINPPVSRGIKIVSKSDIISVKGQAIDTSGVLEVTVNSFKTTLKPDGYFSVDLYLQPGDNPLIVRALDNKLNVTVDTFIVSRKLESLITSGKYIALVIGINSYSGYWPPLVNAVNDAKGVASVLKKDYLFDTVITIIDKQATRDNIIHELEQLTNSVKQNDNLLIYYSGHGQFKKELNKGYWVPVDATTNSIAGFISNGDIKTFMGGIKAKHTLLISDACFAGDIFRGRPTESIPFDPNNMQRYYKEVYSKPSRIAITSGGLEEVEDTGKDGHSIFTYYLLKALEKNKSRYLDASQLFNDFRIAVTNNSAQTPLLQVVRDTGDEGGQFIFVRK